MTYDITDFINFDKENVIVVRVDATQYEGWFYEGAGIYRHVWLISGNDIRIADDGIFIYSAQKNDRAVISAEIEIENLNSNKSEIEVITEIFDRQGRLAGSTKVQKFSIDGLKNSNIKQNITVKIQDCGMLMIPTFTESS